jgi:Tfp pilus assembly protein PilV
MSHPLNTTKSITLVELLVSILIVTILVLSFYSLETFSHGQVINSERRAKVQNQLAYVLEHMSKYVQRASGNTANKPIVETATGFQVRVDFNDPQTPSVLADYTVGYSLDSATHTLSTTCSGSANCPFGTETLSNKIIGNFVSNAIMPNSPTDGFYVKVDPLGNFVDIGLVGCYNPSQPPNTAATRLTNPQVEMKTKLICNNSSTH